MTISKEGKPSSMNTLFYNRISSYPEIHNTL